MEKTILIDSKEKEETSLRIEEGSSKDYYSKENYGFFIQNPDNIDDEEYKKEYKRFKIVFDDKVNKQTKRWMIKEKKGFEEHLRNDTDFKKLTRKGIPPVYRGEVWFLLSGGKKRMKKNIGLYQKLLKDNQNIETESTDIINKDLDRTFPEHPDFNSKSLQPLKRVLYAYSFYNKKIGYCQCFNFIVGSLLLNMEEEETFWTFVCILEDYLPPDFYDDNLSGVKVELYVLESILIEKNKKLMEILKKHNLELPILTQSWFMSLFVGILPIETTFRIWDSFFFEGYKILYRISITLFSTFEKELLNSKDIGDIMMTIKNGTSHFFDCRMLMKNSFNIKRFSKIKIKNHRLSFRDRNELIINEEKKK
eukprot:gene350-6764_t